MTEVIHIRDSTPGGSPNEIYIGRPGKSQPNAIWGNPCVKGKACLVCGLIHKTNGSTLDCYRKYLIGRLDQDQVFRARFGELKNKKLVCFCRPRDGFGGQRICHGQVMAEILDSLHY